MKYGIIKVKRAFLYEENGVDVVDEVFFGPTVTGSSRNARGWYTRNLSAMATVTVCCK